MVTALQVVFRSLALIVGGHRPVALDNLALRQQLAAWTRSNRRPRLRAGSPLVGDRRLTKGPVQRAEGISS